MSFHTSSILLLTVEAGPSSSPSSHTGLVHRAPTGANFALSPNHQMRSHPIGCGEGHLENWTLHVLLQPAINGIRHLLGTLAEEFIMHGQAEILSQGLEAVEEDPQHRFLQDACCIRLGLEGQDLIGILSQFLHPRPMLLRPGEDLVEAMNVVEGIPQIPVPIGLTLHLLLPPWDGGEEFLVDLHQIGNFLEWLLDPGFEENLRLGSGGGLAEVRVSCDTDSILMTNDEPPRRNRQAIDIVWIRNR